MHEDAEGDDGRRTPAEADKTRQGHAAARVTATIALLILGPTIGFARDAYDLVGVTPNRVFGALLGAAAIGVALFIGAAAIRDKYPDSRLASHAVWIAPAAGLVLFAVGTLFRDPLAGPAPVRMEGRTNIALVDFAAMDRDSELDKAGRNLVGILESGLDDIARAEGVVVESYHVDDGAPLSIQETRTAWTDEFVRDTDAHLIVTGLYKPLQNWNGDASPDASVESVVEMMIYVRPDAIPDAPELSSWLNAGSFVTLADISGERFSRANEEVLAAEMAGVVNDLAKFIEATDSMRAGRPQEAAEQLQRLASDADSAVLPRAFVDLYHATALLLSADLVSVDERTERLVEAESVLAAHAGEFARADFLLAEVGLQRLVDETEGCAKEVDQKQVDDLLDAYGSAPIEDLDAVTAGKATLGALKTRACAAISAHPDVGPTVVSSIRAEADALVERLSALDEPELSAARPVAARALTLWPELVLLSPAAPDVNQAIDQFGAALDVERRPERRMTIWLGLAILSGHACDSEGAESALQRAMGVESLAVQQERILEDQARRTRLDVAEYVDGLATICPQQDSAG